MIDIVIRAHISESLIAKYHAKRIKSAKRWMNIRRLILNNFLPKIFR